MSGGKGGQQVAFHWLLKPHSTQVRQLCAWACAFTLNVPAAAASTHSPKRNVLITITSIPRGPLNWPKVAANLLSASLGYGFVPGITQRRKKQNANTPLRH